MDNPFKRIDDALAQYYTNCHRNDYYDEDGVGKFMKFVNENEFDEDGVDLELQTVNECLFIEMDDEFPLLETQKNENYSRDIEIFNIIKYCYIYGVAPNQMNDNKAIPSVPNNHLTNPSQTSSESNKHQIFTNCDLDEIENDLLSIQQKKQNTKIIHKNINKSAIYGKSNESKDGMNVHIEQDIDTKNEEIDIFTKEKLDEIENELKTEQIAINYQKKMSEKSHDKVDDDIFEQQDNKYNDDEWGDLHENDHVPSNKKKKSIDLERWICNNCQHQNNLKEMIINDMKCIKCDELNNPTNPQKQLNVSSVNTSNESVNELNEMGYDKSLITDTSHVESMIITEESKLDRADHQHHDGKKDDKSHITEEKKEENEYYTERESKMDDIETNHMNKQKVRDVAKAIFNAYYYKMQSDYEDHRVFWEECIDNIYPNKTMDDINDEYVTRLESQRPNDDEIRAYCQEIENKDEMNEEEYALKDAFTNFPTVRKLMAILRPHLLVIIKECDAMTLTETSKFLSQFDWNNILEIVDLEFYPNLSSKLQKVVNDAQYDGDKIDDEVFERITTELQGKKSVSTDEIKLLSHIVYKHRYYNHIYDAFSISYKSFIKQKWNESNDINLRKIAEVYGVHYILMHHNNPLIIYNIFHFVKQYLKLNKDSKEEFLQIPEILQLYLLINKPIEFHPIYIINDNMKNVMDYVFATSYFVNYILDNIDNNKHEQISNVNICIIPQRVQLLMDKTVSYQHNLPDFEVIDGCKKIIMSTNDAEQIYHQMTEVYDKTDIEKGGEIDGITIVVDRRSNDNNDRIYFYPFYDYKLFEPLFANYLLNFTFHIDPYPDDQTIICYLWWALYQKVRFFPEMVVSLIPKLFIKDSAANKQKERVELIYSNAFLCIFF